MKFNFSNILGIVGLSTLIVASSSGVLASSDISLARRQPIIPYTVYQGKESLGAYESQVVAVREARKWADSSVKKQGKLVWNRSFDLYGVHQNGVPLGAYESREVAIREARKWESSQVIQNGILIWDLKMELYVVYQNDIPLGAYKSQSVAIREARKWANSKVKQYGKIVWDFNVN